MLRIPMVIISMVIEKMMNGKQQRNNRCDLLYLHRSKKNTLSQMV